MYQVCRHIKIDGSKCKAPAVGNAAYCYYHLRLHRMQHRRKAEAAAEPAWSIVTDAPIDLPVMEDRAALQLAVTQVLQGLAAKRLDPNRAGKLFYGLQIASQVIDPFSAAPASSSVRSVTTDSDGEELAPEQLACEADDDCSLCPRKKTCPDVVEVHEE